MLTPGETHSLDAATTAAFENVLEQRTGQRLGPGRQWRIVTALTPLVQELNFGSLHNLAASARASSMVAERVIDALVNGESSFFRDAATFALLPDVIRQPGEAGSGPIRLWSAGCSTGQEPLSLAILAAEAGRTAEIVATDVSAAAVARARAGRFSQFEIQRGLSVHRMIRWFDGVGSEWIARDELLRAIRFRVASLLDPLPGAGGFDLVLCRNVLFYLTPEARRTAVRQLRAAVRPGGYLILGAGETLIGEQGWAPSARFRGAYEAVDSPHLAACGRAA